MIPSKNYVPGLGDVHGIATNEIIDGAVTAAKLAAGATAGANPMTTASDMIIGGAAGAPARLAVNATATVKYVKSVSGATTMAAPSLADLATPVASFAMGAQKITGVANPTLAQDAVTKAYADDSLIHTVVVMTAAQVNGAYAAPFEIVPAPGANKMIMVQRINLVLIFGAAAFASGGVPIVQYDTTVHGAGTNSCGANLLAANVTAAASSTTRRFSTDTDTVAVAGIANKSICFSNATGAFTTGTGCTLAVHVYYTIIPSA